MAKKQVSTCFDSMSNAEFKKIDAAATDLALSRGLTQPANTHYRIVIEGIVDAKKQELNALLKTQDAPAPKEVPKPAPAPKIEEAAEAVNEDIAEDAAPAENLSAAERDIINAVDSAVSEEAYNAAVNEMVDLYLDDQFDSPLIEKYLKENAKDRAFMKLWNEFEVANNAVQMEAEAKEEAATKAANKRGRADSAARMENSVIPPETVAILSRAFGVFRGQPLATPAMRQGTKPTVQALERMIATIQRFSKFALPIRIVPNPAAIGLEFPGDGNPTGVFVGGKVYLFSDSIGSLGEAQVTLFHELFHYGLSKMLGTEAYHAKMAEMYRDPTIAKYADQWKASSEGKKRQSLMSAQDYNSLSVEEALAAVTEDLYVNNGSGTAPKSLVRKIANWMAGIADSLGMDKVAQGLRAMSQTEAERFVTGVIQSTFGNAGNPMAPSKRGAATFSAGSARESYPGRSASEAELEARERAEGTPIHLVNKYKKTQFGRIVRDVFGGWKANPGMLGWLSLTQLKDRFGTEFTHVAKAVDKWLYMGQRANELMRPSAELADHWAMMGRRDKANTSKLEQLFIDSTIKGVWVDQKAGEMPEKDPRNAHVDFKDPEVIKSVREMRDVFLKLPERHRQLYTAVLKNLSEQYDAKQEALLKRVVDMYQDDFANIMDADALMDIARMGKVEKRMIADTLKGTLTKKELLSYQKLLADLDSMGMADGKTQGPYFPLQRKGEHLIVFKSKDYKTLQDSVMAAKQVLDEKLDRPVPEDEADLKAFNQEISDARKALTSMRKALEEAKSRPAEYTVVSFDSIGEATDYGEEMTKAKGDTGTVAYIRKQDFQPNVDSIPAGFLNKLTANLSKNLPPESAANVAKSVREMIVKSLPERSGFKGELRRMNVAGVKPEDALDSFRAVSGRNGWTISRLENVHDLTKALNEAHSSVNMDERAVGNELMKRYAESMTYTPTHAVIDSARNISYLAHLGGSVGYYFQNMLQPWTTSVPVMGGRFGLKKSADAMYKASHEVVLAMLSTSKLTEDAFNLNMELDLSKFTKDEQNLINTLTEQGRINITIRSDLGVGGADSNVATHLLKRTAEISSWPAHQLEIVNRVATALAAFRLEQKEKKSSFADAMRYADKIVEQTHIDYSAENAPRMMSNNSLGGLGQLTWQFKRYQQGMAFLWTKTFMDAYRQGGWNENTKAMVYMLGTTIATSGASGIPLAAPMVLAAWVLSKAIDDPEREKDYLEMFWASMEDSLGSTATALLRKGGFAALGVDMSASIGFGNIYSPIFQPPSGNTGQAWAGSLAMQIFGAAGGTAANVVDGFMLMDDNPAKAAQKLIPFKGAANMIEGVNREFGSGVTDRKGNSIIESSEMGSMSNFAKALGIGEATTVTNMYDKRSATNTDDQARQNYRSRLLRELARARVEGSSAEAVRNDIIEFNKRNPRAVQIKSEDERSYYKAYIGNKGKMVDGVRVSDRAADIAELYGVKR